MSSLRDDGDARSAKGAAGAGAAPADYETAKALLVSGDAPARARLAATPGLAPELLYYLADDDDAGVRGAVVANPATPVRAYGRLARDPDPRVRVLLAQRLAVLLPDLRDDTLSALRDMAHHALEMLAIDQLARVRAALASAIADVECAPPGLVARLARDVAREVAEPVLRACAGLTDADLLDILARRPEPWVADAIAGRAALDPTVAGVARARQDAAARAAHDQTQRRLLARVGAPAPPPLLDEHGAPVGADVGGDARPDFVQDPEPHFSPDSGDDLVTRMAAAVEESLAVRLAARGELDDDGADAVADTARRRLNWAREYAVREPAQARAARLWAQGALDEDVVGDALSWGDRAFVCAALALLVGTTPEVVGRVLDTQSPRAVTALAWRAGFSMRGARLLQARGARIEPRRLLNARLGTDYPLTQEEMSWHLELFDIK